MPFLPPRVRNVGAAAALIAAAFVGLAAVPCAARQQSGPLPQAAGSIEYSEAEPTPSGTLHIARPTLTWKIVPQGTCRVTGVNVTINGKATAARYDTDRRAVVGTPDAPLVPGRYRVHYQVTLNGNYTVEKDGEFSVAATALPHVDRPDTTQAALCAEINTLRRTLSLPLLSVDDRLCAAASRHSGYLAVNREIGHTEIAGKAEYTAASMGERVQAFGYDGLCYETVSKGAASALSAVQHLLDAPYHRAPFLQPGATDMGAGLRNDVVTLLFGSGESSGVMVYPVNGQKEVPTTWSGNESPNPLRLHQRAGVSGPTGYVITFFAFGPDNPSLTVSKATLTTTTGQMVPIFLNTPANDEFLPNGAFLIPCQPLLPATTYRVSVTASSDAGVSLSRTWNFTTAAAAPAKH